MMHYKVVILYIMIYASESLIGLGRYTIFALVTRLLANEIQQIGSILQ